MKRIIIAALAATTMMSGAAYANNGHGNGNGNGHNNGNGWGVGNVPPGHQKKIYRQGDHLPDGYRVISDYHKYGLPAPGNGYRYAQYNGEIFKIAVQTAAVAATVGLVANLLSN